MKAPVVEALDEPSDQPPDSRRDTGEGAVRFRLRDVLLPPAHELLDSICGGHELHGQVVAWSRSEGNDACAIVKLADRDQLVVVSTEKLLSTP